FLLSVISDVETVVLLFAQKYQKAHKVFPLCIPFWVSHPYQYSIAQTRANCFAVAQLAKCIAPFRLCSLIGRFEFCVLF
ncbi:MAG: hypothetical protein SOZ34_07225, partial [Clostridia bacterium]|nr:hypothetical protein [Clostridia bacterium]